MEVTRTPEGLRVTLVDKIDILIAVTSVIVAVIVFHPAVRRAAFWRATITPLASIVGSGFLIIAPLLHAVVGKWALLVVIIIVTLAYGIGSVIRFNILHLEPRLATGEHTRLQTIERLGSVILSGAYVISVAFYTRLLAAFILNSVGIIDDLTANGVTTVILLFIVAMGYRGGFRSLESLEAISVSIKISIIGGLLVGLAWFSIQEATAWFQHDPVGDYSLTERLRIVAGLLMVTQGFETSRYLQNAYPAQLRIDSMRFAQLLSAGIYILFIGLTCPIFLIFPIETLSETTISSTLGQVAYILPALLLVAAIMSQFSAAVADTVGSGGLIRSVIPKLPDTTTYTLTIGLALVLVWTADVFEIIAYASRGFALYYLCQVVLAYILCVKSEDTSIKKLNYPMLLVLGILLAGVILFALPAETSA